MRKAIVIVLVSLMICVLGSYLNAQEGLLLKTLTGHNSWIRSVSFSPDGKYIASAGGDGDNRIKLWSVESGECVKTLVGHTNAVTSVSFSPDGKYIASGSWDRTIKLWSVVTGKCIKTLKGKIGVESISFSPDGRYVASGSMVDPIKLWSVESGECIKTLKGPALATRIVLFSPDGKYIASGSDSGTIELWSVESGECLKALKGRTGFAVFGVSFSPDGKYIASGGDDGTIKLWSVETGECLKALKGHTGTVFSVSFSPDGKYIVSGSQDCAIKLWSVETSECMKTLIGHPEYVYSVSFSPDGKYIASASQDNTVKLWANIFMYKFVYIGSADTELKSLTGRVLTKLPMGTKVEIATRKKNLLYIKVSETLEGWVKEDDVSLEKPVIDYTPKYVQLEAHYFTCDLPDGWGINRDKITAEAEKVYGLEAVGPRTKEGVPVRITVNYYSRDNTLFKNSSEYVDRNSKESIIKIKGNKYSPVKAITVSGRKAKTFERETSIYLPPDTPWAREVRIKEKLVVVSASEGFYVLRYYAQASVYEKYFTCFERVLKSFTPMR
ncbi:WD40 repeat domain-containing protein [bacterium]|nr:WD40 repeat domain-containing protein [bacterium]